MKKIFNEAETRAEYIDPALAQAGWGVIEGEIEAGKRYEEKDFNKIIEIIAQVFTGFQRYLYERAQDAKN